MHTALPHLVSQRTGSDSWLTEQLRYIHLFLSAMCCALVSYRRLKARFITGVTRALFRLMA